MADEPRSEVASVYEVPMWVWQVSDRTIRILNPAAEALTGLAREQLIGHRVTEFLSPTTFVDQAASALASGALNAIATKRKFTGRSGGPVPVSIWTRGVDITDGSRSAISLVLPDDEVGRLGPDPGRPWRRLADVVIGQTDESWRILRISKEVPPVFGVRPRDLVGTSLRDLVQVEDVDGKEHCSGNDHRLPMRGRLRRPDGNWTDVGLMFAKAEGTDQIGFALIANSGTEEQPDRVALLEQRLRRIADEVRAARVTDTVHMLPDSSDLPLANLSSRQWEMLSRLLQGQRVGTIARELYLSPSTVRNHLSAIFRQFGVHSQRELLDLIHGR